LVGSGLPSTTMVSLGPTTQAGVVNFSPFTMTRPASIQRSASRLEHNPARAMTLAMRSCLSGVEDVSDMPMGWRAWTLKSSILDRG